MPITVTNNTGRQLELWDVGNQLANLAAGANIGALPTTITSITVNGVGYHRKVGGFLNGSNYSATFVAPNTVVFSGAGVADRVRFS